MVILAAAAGNHANPIYLGATGLFSNLGSVNSYNVTYHPKSNWACPAMHLDEKDAICEDPQLNRRDMALVRVREHDPCTG